uniref:SFRICE_031290 n=1 Tax=Spodoptera frugiperda TaxID=7108 RepID=A0A2H1VNS6_SPOFR
MRVLILLGVVAVALSAPQGPAEKVIAIVSQEFDQQPDGSYRYSYETENGIKAEEAGTLKKATGPDAADVIVAQGGFSYTAPDGTVINLNYIADDDNGCSFADTTTDTACNPEGSRLSCYPPPTSSIQGLNLDPDHWLMPKRPDHPTYL